MRMKNALARVFVPSVRRNHHITPTLRQLHWLPIPQRITFKIAFITFKTLHHKQPSYLAELPTPRRDTSHNLRSYDSPNFLPILKINSEQGRRSFTQLPLPGTPYLILFVLLCLFHPFYLGLRLIFFLHSFSLFQDWFLGFWNRNRYLSQWVSDFIARVVRVYFAVATEGVSETVSWWWNGS